MDEERLYQLDRAISVAWDQLTDSDGFWTCSVTSGGRVTLTPLRRAKMEFLGEVGTYNRHVAREHLAEDVRFVYEALRKARGL
jgi:hypothetical protein